MKKIVIFFMFVTSCIIYPYKFEHIVTQKSTIENPTFTVYVTPGYSESNDIWLSKKIEYALLSNSITVLALSPKQLVTTTTGDTKSAASKNDQTALSKSNVDIVSTTGIFSLTKATYIFQASYDDYSFKVILTKTQEIIASGTFTNNSDIQNNVITIVKEMGIVNKE